MKGGAVVAAIIAVFILMASCDNASTETSQYDDDPGITEYYRGG